MAESGQELWRNQGCGLAGIRGVWAGKNRLGLWESEEVV